jgi:hypothetical protein
MHARLARQDQEQPASNGNKNDLIRSTWQNLIPSDSSAASKA